MTTAIGIRVEEGVLLSSDAQVTGSVKSQEDKIALIVLHKASVAMALTGNVANARMAIDVCTDALQKIPRRQLSLARIKNELRVVLKRLFKEYVDERPGDYEDLSFDFVIGITHHTDGVHLFYTADAALAPCRKYVCLGSGEDVSEYVIGPMYRADIKWSEAALLAIDALAAAKRYDPNTGGPSQFITMRQDGSVGSLLPFDAPHTEAAAKQFREWTGALFLDIDLGDERFTDALARFADRLKEMRSSILKQAGDNRDVLHSLTTTMIPRRKPAKATRRVLPGSTRGRKRRPPSPE